MRIRNATADGLASIGDFVVRLSMQPEHHIVYFGGTPEEIAHSVVTLPAKAPVCLVALEGESTAGLLAIETDSEMGRGWLLGPIIEHHRWHAIADALYDKALQELTPEITELEISCDTRNSRTLEFAARHGYSLRGDWDFLTFSRSKIDSLPASSAMPIGQHQKTAVRLLHDHLFPDANLPGSQMIEGQGDHSMLMVHGDGESPDGYIYLTVEPRSGEAFIDFVGVSESARGGGIGRELVLAGMRWLFACEMVEQIALAVRTDNEPARRLYERIGFVVERRARAFRRGIGQAV